MQLLPALVARPEFAELRRYLDEPRPELRLFQLADKIAELFDRYLAFRPDMILDWDRGARIRTGRRSFGASWSSRRPACIRRRSRRNLRSPCCAGNGAPVPARVSLFGISTLPPFYLRVFPGARASASEVHLFVMRPTPECWGDTRFGARGRASRTPQSPAPPRSSICNSRAAIRCSLPSANSAANFSRTSPS